MTRDIVTVAPHTPFKEVARLLTQRCVGALPVYDAVGGRLLGVVCESDLLPKEWRLEKPLLGRARPRWREEQARAEGRTVRDLMSAPAITVESGATLQQAARLMHRRGVRCLCVTDGERPLVGVVTRGDLLRVFTRPDDEIEREVRDDVGRVLWMDPTGIAVDVVDGVVRLQGEVERHTEAKRLAALTRQIDGVVTIEDRLTWRFDDQVDRRLIPRF
jgi:CBS-domain-containing membrane protein